MVSYNKIIKFLKKHENILKYLSAFLVIFISLVTRSVSVLTRDYAFGFDQGRDYIAAWDIAVNHKWTLIGAELGAGVAGVGGLFHGPLHYYSLALPFIFFGGDPYGGLLLTFILGLLTIAAGFVLGRLLFNFWGGILLSLLIAISPQFIIQSYFVWNSHSTTLFIVLSFVFTYLIKEKKYLYTLLAAFFAGFTYNFELAVAVPLTFTLVIYVIFVLKIRSFKQYGFLILGLLLAYFPMLLFEARHDFMASTGILSYIFGSKSASPHPLQYYLLDHLVSVYYNFTDTFPRQSIIPYFLLLFLIPLSFYWILKEKAGSLKNFIIFCLLLIPCNFLVFAFLKNSVYTYYLLDLNIAYIVLIIYLFFKSYPLKSKIPLFVLIVLLVYFVGVAVIGGIRTFAHDIADTGGLAKMSGKREAIDYIYKDALGKDFGLFVFTGPIYTYPYDYIVTWYGKDKYGYVPHKEKKGLVYLLIEVDTGNTHTYKGWLETVIKDGKVLKTIKLPSGLILQKRQF